MVAPSPNGGRWLVHRATPSYFLAIPLAVPRNRLLGSGLWPTAEQGGSGYHNTSCSLTPSLSAFVLTYLDAQFGVGFRFSPI